jgi:hypothetical protein
VFLQLLVDALVQAVTRPHAMPPGTSLHLVSERRQFVHGIADRLKIFLYLVVGDNT